MVDGHDSWIELLNAQETWMTDESMLEVIPEPLREFESRPEWPRSKALAFLNNNASSLRLNHSRLEEGAPLDLELLNLLLGGIALQIVDWRGRTDYQDVARDAWRKGERLRFLQPRSDAGRWNRGTRHVRWIIHRAAFDFARYADLRLGDPGYPGATAGTFRVLRCVASGCSRLVACAVGQPGFCSSTCAESTGRIQ